MSVVMMIIETVVLIFNITAQLLLLASSFTISHSVLEVTYVEQSKNGVFLNSNGDMAAIGKGLFRGDQELQGQPVPGLNGWLRVDKKGAKIAWNQRNVFIDVLRLGVGINGGKKLLVGMEGTRWVLVQKDGLSLMDVSWEIEVAVCLEEKAWPLMMWRGAKIMALLQKWSDHSPITFMSASEDYGPTPYKFYSLWLTVQGVDDVVVQAMVECSDNRRPDVVLL
ncbi:hypothetical protein E3N88_24030 [Mikania micrantha]|uniref:Uncharacterized protein n=1 Tax=Mikania micrantha TaxID=192012 RepID=A0A5N6NG19_9ASTR|nr:hypothetical protein E3N88_24030 [Mikania micrantha]